MQPVSSKRILIWRTSAILIFLGILFATLWPFNLSPANNVQRLPSGWLYFGRGGIALTTKPLTFDSASGDGCAVELLVRAKYWDSEGTIMGIYSPENPKQFVIRQWHEGLLVTHDRIASGRFHRQKFDLGHAFPLNQPSLIIISSGPKGTVVYINGKQAHTFPHFLVLRQELSGLFVFGNSATDFSPWLGELRGAALYAKEITPAEASQHYNDWMTPSSTPDLTAAVARYDFNDLQDSEIPNQVNGAPNLQVPKVFRVPDKVMLKSPLQEYRNDGQFYRDFLINVIGFIPLGFLLCGYWTLTKNPRFAFVCSVLTCAAFSFSIEVAQAFIPNRGSGWTDVISNTLGGLVGAILAGAWLKFAALGRREVS